MPALPGGRRGQWPQRAVTMGVVVTGSQLSFFLGSPAVPNVGEQTCVGHPGLPNNSVASSEREGQNPLTSLEGE